MQVYKNKLYAVVGHYANGLEVWRSSDGTNWSQLGFAGFGDSNNDVPYWDNSLAIFDNRFYLGNWNIANGGEVWTYSESGECAFSGTVDLEGRTDESGVTITAQGLSAGTFTTTTDSSGAYQLAVPEDTYDLSAEIGSYLDGQKTDQFCAAFGSNTLSDVVLLGGDANDDCIIDILDLSLIGANFDAQDFDPVADINADGKIDILDLTVASGNFHQQCPVDWP